MKEVTYEVGKTVKVDDFDEDRWSECSRGYSFLYEQTGSNRLLRRDNNG